MQYKEHEDFNKWVDQWEDALKNGVFEEPEKSPVPSAKTGEASFFGYTNSNSGDSVKEPDSEYWDNVYRLSKDYSTSDNNIEDDHLDGDLIQEDNTVSKDMANSMINSANPIRPDSIGTDQDVHNPISLGATHDVADLENLEKLKVKLHGLLDKLNGIEGLGQSNAKLESQINSLSKKIDEMSDSLSQGVPSQQGD